MPVFRSASLTVNLVLLTRNCTRELCNSYTNLYERQFLALSLQVCTLTPTCLYRQVLFLLLQFLLLTSQDESKTCSPPTIQQASAQLNKSGGGPLGKFNKNYMAFTMREAQNNFNNLITHQPGNFSGAAIKSSSLSASSLIGDCTSTQSNFPYCNACPVVTDLGSGKFPRYINEVICETENVLCGPQSDGYCKTTSISQELLVSQCDPATGQEKLVPFIQEIRSCCECFLFTVWFATSGWSRVPFQLINQSIKH